MQRFRVPEELRRQRIDVALASMMQAYSRSFVQRLVREQLVRINGKPAKKGNRVHAGDLVMIEEQKLKPSKFKSTDIPLDILYEDEDLLIVNKPAGLLVHPSASEREQSLVNALLHHCGKRLSGIGGELRPGIVHRLDKDTSGVLMVAKHDEAHKDLAKQLQERCVEKHYLTLVEGVMKSRRGTIEAPLLKTQKKGKHQVIIFPGKAAKPSLTHFSVKETFGNQYSLLDVQIITGRMHQIRVHLKALDHPVVGDELYGHKKTNAFFKKLGLNRQFLHAHQLRFQHPRTHEWLTFTAPLPEDLQTIVTRLRSSFIP